MNRIVVGAHYGLRDWLAQRITAVVVTLYTLSILFAVAFCVDGYESWRGLMASGPVRAMSFVFILSVAYHAWVGMRDVWMDYVKPAGIRLTLHMLTLLALAGYAGWAIRIIWSL